MNKKTMSNVNIPNRLPQLFLILLSLPFIGLLELVLCLIGMSENNQNTPQQDNQQHEEAITDKDEKLEGVLANTP
ncbi:MAG: hypothetical protein GW760_04970 [Legionella sp.]|nr:hypothetical protein [Legionella sp.]